MYKLNCQVQNYDWGNKGSESLVAKIYSHNGGNIDNYKKYAEFWMGTHINAPSYIIINDETLSLIEFLRNKFNFQNGLPFLFKVLSINDPLSIQLHPDKKFAEELHTIDKINYKDDNHKPELTIVISDEFELLLGILNLQNAFKISNLIYDCLKFEDNSEVILEFRKSIESFLKSSDYYSLIKTLIQLKENEVGIILTSLFSYVDEDKNLRENDKFILAKNLFNKFGNDKGVIFSFYMNYQKLQKGDAIFINPNIPHAYIRGDCIECMPNSDNVIRLGLTPKFVDTKIFLKILDNKFDTILSDEQTNIGSVISEKEIIYKSPIFNDFYVKKIIIKQNEDFEFKNENFSVLFVLKGEIEIKLNNSIKNEIIKMEEFDTYFIENNSSLYIKSNTNSSSELYLATY